MAERDSRGPQTSILAKAGGYASLVSYQRALMAYDVTFRFCERFLDARDRTRDQLLQAVRSGKQNIVEGSQASATSKEMEIKLTGVARASFEEALEDYLDYLRVRGLTVWAKDSVEATYVRNLTRRKSAGAMLVEICATRTDEVVANVGICLIHQTTHLLRKQIAALERDFVENGGMRERMSAVRRGRREGRV